MNKKVLKTMIALVVIFLVALYVLKIFFPQEFVMAIENEKLIKFGNFIDNSWIACEISAIITSFITYWFYLCAVTRKWFLNWKEVIMVFITIAITHLLYEFDVGLATYIPIIAMVVIPAISNAKLSSVATVFLVHCISQLLSTSIRSLPSLLTSVNYMTITMLGLECYFWLILFYFVFNYKKEN